MLELVLVVVLVARPVWSGTAAPTGPGLLATLPTAAVGDVGWCCPQHVCCCGRAGHSYTTVVLLLLMACSELRLID